MFYDYKMHSFKKTYCDENPGYIWNKKNRKRERKEQKSMHHGSDVVESKQRSKKQSQPEDSEGSGDGYDFELYEEKAYGEHQEEVRMLNIEQERIQRVQPDKKSEPKDSKDSNNENTVESKKEKEKDTDTIGKIRNDDLNGRICTRDPKERGIDILLSGTSATLVIQTNKKLHFGWIGDSNIALQTLKDK